MRQDNSGGARAWWLKWRWEGLGAGRGRENRFADRSSRKPIIMAAMGRSQIMAGVARDTRPPPSGRVARTAMGIACARAFRTTLVVAGLKAEPVSLLDGGPSGARALSSATLIAIHRDRVKSRPPFMPSFLYSALVMRDMILADAKIGADSHKNQRHEAPLAVDRSESFQ